MTQMYRDLLTGVVVVCLFWFLVHRYPPRIVVEQSPEATTWIAWQNWTGDAGWQPAENGFESREACLKWANEPSVKLVNAAHCFPSNFAPPVRR